MSNWPQSLLYSMVFNNLTVFFGAGVSSEFNLKTWGELVDYLGSEMILDNNSAAEFKKSVEEKDYLNAIDLLFYTNEAEAIRLIEAEYMKEETINNIVESNEALLFNLGASAYLTTNIDNSLEDLLSQIGKKKTIVHNYVDEKNIKSKLVTRDFEKSPLVIRLHGDLSRPETMVFSQMQYSKIIREKNFVFEHLVPALFVSTMTVFVGYSINDPDIQLTLENIAKVRGLELNLLFINTDTSITKHKKKLFRDRFGIEVIDFFEGENQTERLKNALKELTNIRDFLVGMSSDEARDIINMGQSSRNGKIRDILK